MPDQTAQDTQVVDVEDVGSAEAVLAEGHTETEEAAKKPARKQVKHPMLFDADGNAQQIPAVTTDANGEQVVPEGIDAETGLPADYSSKTHKPWTRKDFVDETVWLLWRARNYEDKARGYREEAALIEQFGGSDENRKAAERYLKMQREFAELQAQLQGSNIDVEALLANAGIEAPGSEEGANEAG